LEESPLQVLNVDISSAFSRDRKAQGSGQNHRIERAGMLPARFCEFRKQRSLGVADPWHFTPDTPSTRMAGDTRIWRTNGFDYDFL
jgi:hypothetical protein